MLSRLIFPILMFLASAVCANTTSYYPDRSSAYAACQAEGSVPGQACSPSGYSLVRWCGTYTGCTGGCAVIIQTSQAPYPGGQCPYSVQTEYHTFTYPSVACPAGYAFTGPLATDCIRPEKAQAVSSSQPQLGGGSKFAASSCSASTKGASDRIAVGESGLIGNPCDASTGNKLHEETDFPGGFGIPAFRRTYNSLSTRDDGLGTGWSHSLGKRLRFVSATQIQYADGNGSVVLFTKSGSDWVGDADITTKLTVTNGYYTFANGDGSSEGFNPKGLPVSDTDQFGRTTSYSFSADGILLNVTGPFGHQVVFTYGTNLVTVTFPGGSWVKLAKNAKSNLVSATHSDTVITAGVVTQYLYEDTANPHSLTGIVDANNSRFATYAYDTTTGKAVSTQHAGATGKFTLTYNGNQTVIADATGNTQTLTFANSLGVNLLVGRTDSSDGKTRSQAFDAANNLISRTDEEGRITNFVWDGQHRLTSMTEAAGTAVEKTTTYAYASPTLDLPSTISEPDRTTTIDYTGDLPTTITVSDNASSRSLLLTYTTKGQVATISGPRVDVSDTRTLEYWDCTTGAQCGQLKKVTNALGHVTTFDQYDGAGRLLKTTSPNGLATTFVYNKAGNVTSVTETPPAGTGSARTTSFTYDHAQQLKTATLPDGVMLTYTYDAAHRLTSATDNAGNKVAYTYDLKDNRTQTVVKDSAGTIRRQVDYAFNARNFITGINAGGSTTQQVLDAVGNATSITDPNGHATAYGYDALNRVASIVDRLQGTTGATYDAGGRLAGLTTPNGAQWTLTSDGLGNQTAESSPDRGQISRAFDAAGNVLSSTDARGITASFTYDALNRLTSVTYPTSGEDITYSYDSCANGIGRLCSVADPTGSRAYAYDGLGRMASVVWTTGGQTYTASYAWTPTDKQAGITYPSGRIVSFTRNALGQISVIATAGQNIVTGRSYRADGLLSGQTYGNGLVDSRSYDIQGRQTSWVTGSIDSRNYGYGANGNITSINANSYGYDWLDRIVNTNSIPTFTYDANGNRLADGGGSYAYTANSNRMTSSPSGAVTLDAAGNTLAANGLAFEFNQAGRLAAARSGGNLLGQYAYSFNGHRAQKTVQGTTTRFHYGTGDNLLAETDEAGSTRREYVWDDEGRPLAQISAGVITYLHPDHLGSPRIGTDASKNVVWQWQDVPFGVASPSGSVSVALRYPGQYHEAETGVFQNWNRTYYPDGGRYLESDSIGLAGGINTYAYVGGNPLGYKDPNGEFLIGAAIGGVSAFMGVYSSDPNASYLTYAAAIAVGAGVGAVTQGFVPPGLVAGIVGGVVSGAAGNTIGQYAVAKASNTTFAWNWCQTAVQGGIGGISGGIGAGAGILGLTALNNLGEPAAQSLAFSQAASAGASGIAGMYMNLPIPTSMGGSIPSSSTSGNCTCKF